MTTAHRAPDLPIAHLHAALAGVLSLLLALTMCLPAAAGTAAASSILRTITIGLEPYGLVEDSTVGHALVFNTWGPSAMIVDVHRGTVLRTLHIGSLYDFVWSGVDPLHHRFVLGLQRGAFSKGGGNVVYLIDSRTGAIVRSLAGLRTPVGVAVDPARSHIFVADTHSKAVLEYESSDGTFERAEPSCSGTEDLALSTATQYLFVRCSDGTILMQDLGTGRIITRLVSQATGAHNFVTDNFGTNIAMSLQEQTHRLVVSNLATGAARLYDSATGRLVEILPSPSGGYMTDTGNNTAIANAFTPNPCAQPAAGRFQVLDAESGAVLATHSVPYKNVVVRLANPLTGHLLADITGRVDSGCHYLGQGSLAVIDARSGRILRLLPAGYSPSAMLIDRRSGLLLQLSRGTGMEPGSIIVFDLAQL